MTRTKENAYTDWFKMIFKSWTWDRLTEKERTAFVDQMDTWCNYRGLLIGTYKQRWEILNELYHIYLMGVGYDSPNWRETDDDVPQF